MWDFMDRHAARLDPMKVDVERLLMLAVNTDIKGIDELLNDTEPLRQASSFATPANGMRKPRECGPVPSPLPPRRRPPFKSD